MELYKGFLIREHGNRFAAFRNQYMMDIDAPTYKRDSLTLLKHGIDVAADYGEFTQAQYDEVKRLNVAGAGQQTFISDYMEPTEEMTKSKAYIEKLKEALDDETKAGPDYRHMANMARELGYRNEADALGEIAADEDNHRNLIYQMLKAHPHGY